MFYPSWFCRSTDFINTIIFPGSCCPSLHALVDASYKHSTLTLEHIDNIGLHYARTLAEWRRRFNSCESSVRKMGFDDIFMRVWNYYLTYCEAGFHSQTENCKQIFYSVHHYILALLSTDLFIDFLFYRLNSCIFSSRM